MCDNTMLRNLLRDSGFREFLKDGKDEDLPEHLMTLLPVQLCVVDNKIVDSWALKCKKRFVDEVTQEPRYEVLETCQ